MRRSPIALATLGAMLILIALAQQASAPASVKLAPSLPPAERANTVREDTAEYHPVVRVVDGDTFIVEKEGAEVRVRLIGLDTPESVDPRKTVECFGKEAAEKARALLEGQHVRLEQDPTQDTHDKYGRLLAYAYLPDGLNVAEYLILEGYGHEYTYHFPYGYKEDFEAAEKTAREEKRGLWADGACSH